MSKMMDEWKKWQHDVIYGEEQKNEDYTYPTSGAFYDCWKAAWMKASECVLAPVWEDFEQWCEKVELTDDREKALALMAWNASYELYRSQMRLMEHELHQTRYELAACETTLNMERKERAK